MQKLRRRKDILNKTATWSENEKAEFGKGMQLCCMSPEHSEENDDEERSSSSSESDGEGQQRPKTKVIRVRPLSWRSEKLVNLFNSLDRKHMRKSSERARSMMKKRGVGDVLEQRAPDSVPAWMVKKSN